jgi:hypothetical protein
MAKKGNHGDHHTGVHRVRHPLWPALRGQPLVRGDNCHQKAEYRRFQFGQYQVGRPGERGEGRDVATRGPTLRDDVEQESGDHPGEGHHAAQHDADKNRGDDAGSNQSPHRRYAHHLQRVDLLPNGPCAQIAADRRSDRAGQQQRDDDRRALPDHPETTGRADERAGADLLGEAADLDGDDHAERHRDQQGGYGRHRDDEPGLLGRLLPLESAFDQVGRQEAQRGDRHHRHSADGGERIPGPLHDARAHQPGVGVPRHDAHTRSPVRSGAPTRSYM